MEFRVIPACSLGYLGEKVFYGVLRNFNSLLSKVTKIEIGIQNTGCQTGCWGDAGRRDRWHLK